MRVCDSVVCRICKLYNSDTKQCSKGETMGAASKDECWTFSRKNSLNLAEGSQDRQDWRLS